MGLIQPDDLGKLSFDDVASCTPSAKTIKVLAEEMRAKLNIIVEESILQDAIAVYFSADKAESKKKQDKSQGSHFGKVISFWSDELERVDQHLLDADGSGGKSEECAEVAEDSIKRLLPEGKERHCLHGQCTDSGGGGTLGSFADELRKLNLCVPFGYIVLACCLHCLQLSLSTAIISVLGEGGLEGFENSRTGMQLLFSVYNLQSSWCTKEV